MNMYMCVCITQDNPTAGPTTAAAPRAGPSGKRTGTGKRKIVEGKCTGLTEKGKPCRKDVVPGMDVCKKHRKEKQAQIASKEPCLEDLPEDEQAWFRNGTNKKQKTKP